MLSDEPLTTNLSLYCRQAIPRLWPFNVRTNSQVLVLHTCRKQTHIYMTQQLHTIYSQTQHTLEIKAVCEYPSSCKNTSTHQSYCPVSLFGECFKRVGSAKWLGTSPRVMGGLDWGCLFLESWLPTNPASGSERPQKPRAGALLSLTTAVYRVNSVEFIRLVDCCPLLVASGIATVKQTSKH